MPWKDNIARGLRRDNRPMRLCVCVRASLTGLKRKGVFHALLWINNLFVVRLFVTPRGRAKRGGVLKEPH